MQRHDGSWLLVSKAFSDLKGAEEDALEDSAWTAKSLAEHWQGIKLLLVEGPYAPGARGVTTYAQRLLQLLQSEHRFPHGVRAINSGAAGITALGCAIYKPDWTRTYRLTSIIYRT